MDPGSFDSSTSPRSSAPVVAAFDVDKTLTTHDCVLPFLRRVGGVAFAAALVRHTPPLAMAALKRERDRAKVLMTRAAVTGRPLADVDRIAHEFADHVWARRMRPDTVARLRWHARHGHRVVLVSASYRNYLDPLAERLGVETVLSTELEVVDGRCTGELSGPNCRGAVKAARLSEWIRQGRVESPVIYAYGDSSGDRDMLELSDHPVLVGSARIDESPEVVR